MIRMVGTVEYDGGETAGFRAGSAAFVAWEAYARRQGFEAWDKSNVNTLAAYVAYVSLGIREGFDVWLKSVVDVDAQPPAAVDPIPAGVSLE